MIDIETVVEEAALKFCNMNVMTPCENQPCDQHLALAGIAADAMAKHLPSGVVYGGDWRTCETLWTGRKLYHIDQRKRERGYDRSARDEILSERSAPEADLISSRVLGIEGDMHMPAIDIDFPVYAVQSDTPGHSHLYINRQLPWEAYVKLLHAMAEAGLVEKEYANMSEARGASFLYMPGKGNGPKREKASSDYWG
jgi:hypothetical protein